MSACVTSVGQDCFAALAMTPWLVPGVFRGASAMGACVPSTGQNCFAARALTPWLVIASAAKQSHTGSSAAKQSRSAGFKK